jgi:transposase
MSNLLTEKEKERFKAQQLHAAGKSNKYIAQRMNKTTKWVTRTLRRFEELGNFKDRGRSGRPKAMTPGDSRRLVKQAKGKMHRSTRKLAGTFKPSSKKKVGRETIRKVLKTSGLYPHRKRKTPLLTDDHKERRVAFAKNYRRYDWTNCAFWDETEFELYPTPNPKNDIVWDEKGTEYRYGKSAHPPTFKFGGAITVNGPTRLVPYTGTIDSQKYREMIDEVIADLDRLFGHHKWTLIQDGARPHVAKATLAHFDEVLPSYIPPEDWPPNSPDENAADNVFGYLDSKIQEKGPTTLRALEANIRSEWKKLTPDYCRNCIEVIPKRLAQIERTKGEYVYKLDA